MTLPTPKSSQAPSGKPPLDAEGLFNRRKQMMEDEKSKSLDKMIDGILNADDEQRRVLLEALQGIMDRQAPEGKPMGEYKGVPKSTFEGPLKTDPRRQEKPEGADKWLDGNYPDGLFRTPEPETGGADTGSLLESIFEQLRGDRPKLDQGAIDQWRLKQEYEDYLRKIQGPRPVPMPNRRMDPPSFDEWSRRRIPNQEKPQTSIPMPRLQDSMPLPKSKLPVDFKMDGMRNRMDDLYKRRLRGMEEDQNLEPIYPPSINRT